MQTEVYIAIVCEHITNCRVEIVNMCMFNTYLPRINYNDIIVTAFMTAFLCLCL